MAIEKILILAMPRTGTTIIQQILSNAHKLENLSEPLHKFFVQNDPKKEYESDDNPYQWASQQKSGIMKVLSAVLEHLDFEKFMNASKFDQVILIERDNLVDGLLSLKYAEITKKYHRSKGETLVPQMFSVDQFDLALWNKSYTLYNQAKEFIIKSGVPYNLVHYDQFMADIPQMIAGHTLQKSMTNFADYNIVPNELCYKDLCINYQEVETYIRNKTC
jgi:hypothetical protein